MTKHLNFYLKNMAKNRFPHFNPEEHKIETKMASVKSGSHCKFNINYHIIWIPKYRKAVLTEDKLKEVLKTILYGVCEDNKCEVLALEIMPDHLHLFVGANPTITPSLLVKNLKGNTSRQLRLLFKDIRYLGFKKHFGDGFKNLWARGYYCGTAGHVSQDAVKRYILEQDGKSVFEYDIYDCPKDLKGKLKVGNFTQTKLEGFNSSHD